MRTGGQAVAQMRRWHKNKRRGVKGYCLKTVREAYLLPAKYPSAIVAWRATPARFKHTDHSKAPIGACHYYQGGRFGHIVIQSSVKNRVFGTDLPLQDRVGIHHRRMPVNRWGYKYLGWTNWLNGHELKLGKMPK